MAAGTVSLSGNVFEMLIGHNYERWSVLMKNYLIGEGLWDVISCDDVGDDPDLWRKRNAKALFALQLSCGPDIFKTKSDVDSARDAWSRLISLGSDAKGIPLDLGFSDSYVHQGVKRGDLDVVNSILRSGNNEHRTTDASGKTVLHTAVIAGHEHIVEMLLAKIDLLEMRDNAGYTALALVAQLSGNTTMARLMVERIPSLVDFQTLDYQSPLLLASGSGHKELTHYLASRTEVIEDPEIVAVLLSNCITAEIIDLVSLWISCRGRVRISPGSLHRVNRLRQGGYYRPAPLLALASMPSVFRSGCRLNWWQRAIYPILNVGAGGRDQELYSHVLNVGAGGRDQELYSHGRWWLSRVGIFIRDSILRPLWRSRVGIFFHNSILLKVSPIKELCDRKLVHIQVRVISKLMGRMLRGLDEPQLHEASAYEAMLQAAKYGIVEFIELICEANRVLLWTVDRNKRGIFSHAILNRQGKLFKYLLDETEEQMRMITPRQDVFGNNMLHQAAGLGPSSDLDCRFGAALQLQSEIRWFKEVEKISHPTCKEATNARGKKPREVFSESYKELMEAGEKWAKETATSFTIVCTLIITITFAAAFTVPGGTNQDTGFPIFLKNTLFEVLIMADVASLVTSSSLVLISIVILTSRYTQRDFVTRLPIMLMANLLSLFMSVAAMMVAFCAGIAMML